MEENTILDPMGLEEKEELNRLRAEKQRSEMTGFAAESLQKYSIDNGFAPYLVGGTKEETIELVQRFARQFEGVQARAISAAPTPNVPTEVAKSTRGIRIL